MGETGGDQERKNRIKGENVAWEIWKERCQAMHDENAPRPEGVIQTAVNLAEETWKLRRVESAETGRPTAENTRRNITPHRWRKPRVGIIKLNCDATWVVNTPKEGTCVVARDWERRIIVGRNTTSKDISAKKLEVKVIYQDLELAIHHKWEDVII